MRRLLLLGIALAAILAPAAAFADGTSIVDLNSATATPAASAVVSASTSATVAATAMPVTGTSVLVPALIILLLLLAAYATIRSRRQLR